MVFLSLTDQTLLQHFIVQNYSVVLQQYIIPILEDLMCKQKKLAFMF